jgi:hypothetical protein
MPGELRWIFTNDRDHREVDQGNHGTCVLSKAVSPMFGTAKNPKIVLVKMPALRIDNEHQRNMVYERELLAGLIKILDDVKSRELQGKAVVNISWGCKYKVLKTQLTCEYLLMYIEQFRDGKIKIKEIF